MKVKSDKDKVEFIGKILINFEHLLLSNEKEGDWGPVGWTIKDEEDCCS